MSKILISIPSENKDQENAWVKENADLEGGENTFTENKVDADGNTFCTVSFPDSNSPYCQAMKEHFADYLDNTDLVQEFGESSVVPIRNKGGRILNQETVNVASSKLQLTDIADDAIAPLQAKEEITPA